ncbi:MAG: peptide chain release factor aRF-1 [Nanoarchaeota archaeon]|nr:peptide chain release factor aRF-1 [Nanoarchaeota archaeon]
MDATKRYELEETIKELEGYRGRHTELISVLIPAGTTLTQIGRQIETEKGTASNIKSKNTRKSVMDALERISRQLKLIERTPENGLALYCGNVSSVEGQEDIQIWSIEPPKQLKTKLYRCDQTFLLDPLKEMVETEDIYGLIVIDRKEATIGLLEGKSIKVLQHLTSGVPSKVRAGGQSAARFSRITEGLAKEFFRRAAEALKNHFFENKKLKGILVGGPIPTKEEFIETGNIATALKNKIIGVKDMGNTDEYGLRELVNLSQDVLAEQEVTKEKKILDEFFMTLAKEPEKIAYGDKDVEQRLKEGMVKTLIIAKSLKRERIKEFEALAAQTSSDVHIVSKETTEGMQFDNLGGVGAILRFAVA